MKDLLFHQQKLSEEITSMDDSDFIKFIIEGNLFCFSKKGIRGVSINIVEYSKRNIKIVYIKGPDIDYDNVSSHVAEKLYRKIMENIK